MYPKFGMLVAGSLLSFRYVYNVLINCFFYKPIPQDKLIKIMGSKSNYYRLVKRSRLFSGKNTDSLNTLTLVFIMVGVVKGVFISFAVLAVCFRFERVCVWERLCVRLVCLFVLLSSMYVIVQ